MTDMKWCEIRSLYLKRYLNCQKYLFVLDNGLDKDSTEERNQILGWQKKGFETKFKNVFGERTTDECFDILWNSLPELPDIFNVDREAIDREMKEMRSFICMTADIFNNDYFN